MISLNDYTAHDGLGLAELVARKEVTPDELGAAAFEAVARVNPRINLTSLAFGEGVPGATLH